METQVSDKFLVDFLEKYSYEELDLLNSGLKSNFIIQGIDGKIVTEDYTDSIKIYHEALSLLVKNLYDVWNGVYYPKAKKFIERYIHSSTKETNNGDIVKYYVQEVLIKKMPSALLNK